MFDIYRSIMDSDRNPLRHLPAAQRFQVMALLSMMWTTIFCSVAGTWFWYGELISGHILLAFGTLVTGYTFHNAEKAAAYRDQPKLTVAPARAAE